MKIFVTLDDLFDDEDAEPKGKEVAKESTESPRKKYLDQKWKLNNEDAKDFKGFPKKEGSKEVVETKEKAPRVPCMALMYKFRKEYVDNSCDEAISDHKGHCAKFKRILNSEALSLGKSRGCVILWAGFSDSDKADLKAEIMTFMEEDPLITKDIVDNWVCYYLILSNHSYKISLLTLHPPNNFSLPYLNSPPLLIVILGSD